MNLKRVSLLCLAVLLIAGGAWAQKDGFGKPDTLYLEPYKIDAQHWGVNIALFNDQEVLALSLPIKFMSGKAKIIADSTVFTGGRVENFRVKNARIDTATQCITIALINDIGVSVPPLSSGTGRIATIFVSAMDGQDIEYLVVDTTTTMPSNTLQLVAPPAEEIIPVVSIKSAGKPKMEKETGEAKEEKGEG